jgi:hypothetical protein
MARASRVPGRVRLESDHGLILERGPMALTKVLRKPAGPSLQAKFL